MEILALLQSACARMWSEKDYHSIMNACRCAVCLAHTHSWERERVERGWDFSPLLHTIYMKYDLSSQGLSQLRKPVSLLGKCAPRLNRYGEKETHIPCVCALLVYALVRLIDWPLKWNRLVLDAHIAGSLSKRLLCAIWKLLFAHSTSSEHRQRDDFVMRNKRGFLQQIKAYSTKISGKNLSAALNKGFNISAFLEVNR